MNPLKSLWEPTKQTEQYWRSAIREESLKWEDGGEEDRVVKVTDPDDGFVSWKLNIPKGSECDESETFKVPEGEGQWLTSSHDEPMELPTSVPWPPPQLHGPAEKNCPLYYIATSLSGAPSYDDEGTDGDWKPWAAEIVKGRSVRVHSCFGLVVYLQKPLAWRKRNVRTDLQRYWDYFDFAATWWHPFKTMPEPRPLELMPPEFAFFSMNTSGIEPFKLTKWETPTPKPAGWRPHVPAFWVKRDDVNHYDYWKRAGKRQPHIQIPWHSEPVPMPWNNPDLGEIAKWELWNGGVAPTFLTTYLKRLLFMNDFIVTDPYPHPKRTRMMFPMYDTDDRVVEFDRHTRRLRLTASCGYRYAKSIECPDHRITQGLVVAEMATWYRDEDGNYFVLVEEQDSDYQEGTWTAGEDQIPIRGVEFDLKHWQSHRNYGVTFQQKIDLRWEIRRRDRRWDFRPEKVPGYQLHESWQSIMAITGCSRATAFRWIEKFMAEPLPEPEPWTPAVRPAPDPGSNRGLVTLPGQTFHWSGLLGATRMARYGQSTIPARWGNIRRKIVLHIQLHSPSRTHPNCPK